MGFMLFCPLDANSPRAAPNFSVSTAARAICGPKATKAVVMAAIPAALPGPPTAATASDSRPRSCSTTPRDVVAAAACAANLLPIPGISDPKLDTFAVRSKTVALRAVNPPA